MVTGVLDPVRVRSVDCTGEAVRYSIAYASGVVWEFTLSALEARRLVQLTDAAMDERQEFAFDDAGDLVIVEEDDIDIYPSRYELIDSGFTAPAGSSGTETP
jgi:hypothetical protein